MEPWWDASISNTLGAWLGASSGVIFGGIGGGIGGPLAAKGKAKTFVLGMFWSAFAIGALLLIAALVTVVLGQPFHVWQWMVFGGVILAAMSIGILPAIQRAYRTAEERKLAAAELRSA